MKEWFILLMFQIGVKCEIVLAKDNVAWICWCRTLTARCLAGRQVEVEYANLPSVGSLPSTLDGELELAVVRNATSAFHLKIHHF